MADISDIQATKRVLHVKHPGTGLRTGLSITLYPVDDERTKPVRRAITDRKLYLEARGKNFKADDLEENMINLQFAAIEGWEWGKDHEGVEATFKGEKPIFNKKNFADVVTTATWVSDAIRDEFNDDKAFFTNSNPT